jgi:hypothetical protein
MRLGALLPQAFERIDKRNALREKQNTQSVGEALKNILPKTSTCYSVEYRDGALTLFTSSQILKQKVQIAEKNIIQEIQKKFPNIRIAKIRFKGPK